jgi:hypothetical protein
MAGGLERRVHGTGRGERGELDRLFDYRCWRSLDRSRFNRIDRRFHIGRQTGIRRINRIGNRINSHRGRLRSVHLALDGVRHGKPP